MMDSFLVAIDLGFELLVDLTGGSAGEASFLAVALDDEDGVDGDVDRTEEEEDGLEEGLVVTEGLN